MKNRDCQILERKNGRETKLPYDQQAGEANERKLADFLSKGGQLLLPMVDLVEQCQMACDELIDVTGRAAIQAVLELSAEQVAGGPRHPEVGPGGGGSRCEDAAHSGAGAQSQFQVEKAGGHRTPRVSGLADPTGRGTSEASSEHLGHALQPESASHEPGSWHPGAEAATYPTMRNATGYQRAR